MRPSDNSLCIFLGAYAVQSIESFNFENIHTYLLQMSGLFALVCPKSTPKKERLGAKIDILSLPWPMKSLLPISIIRPYSATHSHETWSSSPDKELSTMSTPLPFVDFNTAGRKEVSRELKICVRGIAYVSSRYRDFSSLPTVANI